MTPVEALRLIAREIVEESFNYAVCGGIAASIYRLVPRFTNDLDLVISIPNSEDIQLEQMAAEKFLSRLGFTTLLGWFPNSQSERKVFAVIGQGGGNLPAIDILLPALPWARIAVERAQVNLIEYGFASLPTITPEDLIISKAYALAVDPHRPNDRDDIASVMKSGFVDDLSYLEFQLNALGLASYVF